MISLDKIKSNPLVDTFVLKGNEFGTEADINEIAAILFAASAEREDIIKARALHLFGKGWRFLVAAGKNVRA